MFINGKEVKWLQSKDDMSEYYFNVIKREVRQAINELPFARVTKINESKTTDSLYFEVVLNHFDTPFIVTVRSHKTGDSDRNMIRVYITQYDTIGDLRYGVKLKLTKKYNANAESLLIKRYYLKPQIKEEVKVEKVYDEQSKNILLEKAYKYEEQPNGWANLIDVTQTLGKVFRVTTKEMGVRKLRQAYTNSGLYIIKEVEVDDKKEKWIRIKDKSNIIEE